MQIRKAAALLIVMVLLFSVALPAFAYAGYMPSSGEEKFSVTEISPRGEETVIYNRIFEGRLQYRIWSVTQQKWLTDWIDR